MVYVLEGNGSTQVWYDENKKVSFEWKTGSLFAIPLNAMHRHFNGRGDKPARFLAVTNAPVVMNLFHNVDFVFNTPFTFDDRFAGQDNYFDGQGKLCSGRQGRVHAGDELRARHARHRAVHLEGARRGRPQHHASSWRTTRWRRTSREFPVGTYKKGHRHGPGAHVIILSGKGYSLLWPDGRGRSSVRLADRAHGGAAEPLVPPALQQRAEPARYLALRWGSRRYDMGGAIQTKRRPTWT